MNLLVVFLIVVVIVLLYVLFTYFSNSANKLITSSNLLTENKILPITSNPSSTRYAYGIWVYVKSWNVGVKNIFEYPGKIKMYLESSTPTLSIDLGTTTNSPKKITVTQNFPLQKWTYVTVSVDNSYIDLYIDGKLIKSIKIEEIQSDALETSVYLGGKIYTPCDIQVSTFLRWVNALTPQDVWNQFLKGNGTNSWMTSTFSKYGLDLNLKKDNVLSSTYSLF